MKKFIYVFLVFIVFGLHVKAQTSGSIIDELNTSHRGQGNITIYQDNVIKNLVGTSNSLSSSTITNQLRDTSSSSSISREPVSTSKARGYRIQVYSGNDQKKSRTEAYSRRDIVRRSYPNMDVTIAYHSPVWRVRAGNFRSREEAQQALNEMKSKFPSFGKEMHIVDDVIKIPVY